MKYIFDTSAYSQLLRGDERTAAALHSAETVLLPSVVVAELRYGFRLGSRQEENERLLTRFLAAQKVHVLLADNATTDYFVAVALYVRKRGVQLSSHDLWILALAEQWDATLLTFDRDFQHAAYTSVTVQFEERKK